LGWQWRQLDHVQTICTSIQTDNHTNTRHAIFYRPDAFPDAQPTDYSVNALKATGNEIVLKIIIINTVNAISILAVSSHDSFRVLFDKIVDVYFV